MPLRNSPSTSHTNPKLDFNYNVNSKKNLILYSRNIYILITLFLIQNNNPLLLRGTLFQYKISLKISQLKSSLTKRPLINTKLELAKRKYSSFVIPMRHINNITQLGYGET